MPPDRGHLASPADIMAALAEATGDPEGVTFEARAWPEVQFVSMHFVVPGACVVAPVGFHGVSTFTGSSSFLAEQSDAFRRCPRLPEGATLIRRAGDGARYVWTAPHRARMTCLAPQVVTRAALETGVANPDRVAVVTSSDGLDEVLRHLVDVLAEEARTPAHFAQPLMVQSLASAIAVRLVACHSTPGPLELRHPGGLGGPAYRRVRAFVEENLGEHISLDALAAVAGVSRFHFARQFRRRTGMSPMEFVLRSRVERSKAMLRAGKANVGEVASALGFADQSHFTRTFRRFVGTTPARYSSRGLVDGGGPW